MMETPMRALAGMWSGALLLAAVAVHAETQSPTPPIQLAPPSPASPQPGAAALKDGLAVHYYFAKYNHIDELVDWMKFDDGVAGAPLPALDYPDTPGNVLTTTNADLVGAHITGFVRFAEAGTHRLRVVSNDGIRLTLGGETIYEDPRIHKAEASPDLVFDVAAPGWYPLDILYYEKKGTAALQLLWQPPGAPGFVPVPGAALKHS